MDGLCLVGVFLIFIIAWIYEKISKGNKVSRNISPSSSAIYSSSESDITSLDINEIKACGKFTPTERAAEYRRRGNSPSGVIDGVYNDEYRGNDEYNDEYRDWDADA